MCALPRLEVTSAWPPLTPSGTAVEPWGGCGDSWNEKMRDIETAPGRESNATMDSLVSRVVDGLDGGWRVHVVAVSDLGVRLLDDEPEVEEEEVDDDEDAGADGAENVHPQEEHHDHQDEAGLRGRKRTFITTAR